MEAILPDCEELDLRITLSPEEEEELLQEIAVSGRKGLERFIAKYSDMHREDDFGRELERYRQRLEDQADRLLDHRKGRVTGELDRKREQHFRELDEFRQRQPHIIPDMDRIQIMDLRKIMEKDDLLRLIDDEGPVTFMERIFGWFLRVYLWLRIGWRRFVSFFSRQGKKRRKTPGKGMEKRRMTLTLFGGRTKFNIGVPMTDLLVRPRFRRMLKREMKLTREGSSDPLEDRVGQLIQRHLEAGVKRELREAKEMTEKELEEFEKAEQDMRKRMEQDERREGLRAESELQALREQLRKRTEDPVGRLMERNLVELGFIRQEGEEVIPTTHLLERFADLIFQRELNAIPSTGTRSGQSQRKLGIYEKAKMRSVFEESRMDIVTTLINTRINHPGDRHIYDDDIIVYREESAISTHVVIMFDKSSSMEENRRMEAAKRTVMALYRAVRRQKEKDRIDIIGFDTRVSLMDLMAVWKAEPSGFTNIGGALRNARMLFEDSKTDIKIAYLITDGLPEAYTDEKGNEVAGEPDVCLVYALREAADLDAHLTLILLEPEDESYVEAGKRIVDEAQGRLIVTNPRELMHEVLSDYLG